MRGEPHRRPWEFIAVSGGVVGGDSGGEPDRAAGVPVHGENGAAITVWVFGVPRIEWRPATSEASADITSGFSARLRELLAFLALHPEGVRRDTLIAALWGHVPANRPANALNTSMARLRRAVSTATGGAVSTITAVEQDRYRLAAPAVRVDYWCFLRAITARRAAVSAGARRAVNQRILTLYRGSLAEGIDADWSVAVREAARRDALDAVAALARSVVDSEPEYTLELLELAREWDPYNELVYRDIMRLQARLGRMEGIPRTAGLLRTRLAEVDARPSAPTVDLARRLRDREPPGP